MKRKPVTLGRKLIADVEKPYGYIYITTNLVNNKKYLGQHCSDKFDAKYFGSGILLTKSLKKYGTSNFKSEPIDWANSKEELDEKEVYWIEILGCVSSDNWYNLADGGEGHSSDEAKRFITEHTRKLYSENAYGENNPMYGNGYRVAGEHNGMFGKTHSDEVKSKLSEYCKSHYKGHKNPFYNKKHTEESKEKLRKSKLGNKASLETRELMSKQRQGTVWVNDDYTEERIIHKPELDTYIHLGWKLGRLPLFYKNRIIIGGNNMSELKLLVRYHDELYGEMEPIKKTEQGDWIDLRAAETIEFKAGEFKLISLGISVQMPEGYEAHIATRSSTYKTWGILMANSHGIIDNSYCGDGDIWKFPALAMRDTVVQKGDRICQFRLVKKQESVEFIEVPVLGNADRGGIGSSGTREFINK